MRALKMQKAAGGRLGLQNTKTAIPWSKSEQVSPLRRAKQTAGYGTVPKIGVILCPLHLSYRSSTIPPSLFLFLYNEGL